MKIWNLVAILAISCILPMLAQKQDNAIDTAGLICENELGQFCIDKNDTHKCMFPLAKPECPAGKQCCKIFPKGVDEKVTNLKSAMEGVEGKIADVDSAMKGGDGEMFNVKSAIKSVDEKITNLESAMKGVGNKRSYFYLYCLTYPLKCKQNYCVNEGYQMAYGDSCYFISNSQVTWSDAQEKCVDMGGNLAKIDNDKEFSFLKDQVAQTPWIRDYYWGAWIGLNDIDYEGQFTWIADGSIHQIQESWWHPNEPNDHGGNEDCVHYWILDWQAWLNDLPCTTSTFYICEMASVNLILF